MIHIYWYKEPLGSWSLGPKMYFSTILACPVEYSTDVEISTWKLFFRKVLIFWTFPYIMIFSYLAYFTSYRPLKFVPKSTFWPQNCLKNLTCGLAELTVVWRSYDHEHHFFGRIIHKCERLTKYRFRLQKGVKIKIRKIRSIRDPKVVGSFIIWFGSKKNC